MSERGAISLIPGLILVSGAVGSTVAAAGIVLAQDLLPVAGDNVPTTVLGALAVAISSLTGAIVFLMRLIRQVLISGEWVRLPQAEQAGTLKLAVAALEKADKREERMTEWLFSQKTFRSERGEER